MHRGALFTDDSGGIAAAPPPLLLLLLYTADGRQLEPPTQPPHPPALNAFFRSLARPAVNCTRCKREHQRRQGLHENRTRALQLKKKNSKMLRRQHGAKKGGREKQTNTKQVSGIKSSGRFLPGSLLNRGYKPQSFIFNIFCSGHFLITFHRTQHSF